MLFLMLASAAVLAVACVVVLAAATVPAWVVVPALVCALALLALSLLQDTTNLALPPLVWSAAPLGAFLVALWIAAMLAPIFVPRWLNMPMLVAGLAAFVVGFLDRGPFRRRRHAKE
jgi:hypothetical protein